MVAGQELVLRVTIDDESGVFDPAIVYRNRGEEEFQRIPLTAESPTEFTATIPKSATKTDLEYFVEAYDTEGNGPARFGNDRRPVIVVAMARETKVEAPKDAPAPAVTEESPPNYTGLFIGVGVGAVVIVTASAAAVYYLTRADLPERVTLTVGAPIPVTP